MIVEIQGYNIWTPEAGELANLLDGNQLTIEHRFLIIAYLQAVYPGNI